MKNVILEFYSNLSKSMFDLSFADQFKAYVRGQYIIISPIVIDQFLEKPVAVYTEVPVSLNVVARELTGGVMSSWVGSSLPGAKLSIKYDILFKIDVHNWLPSTHHSTLSKTMATLLYRIGTGIPINFGTMVFHFLEDHAKQNKYFGYNIGFPGMLFGIIASKWM